ncbi:transposase [Octadecabacter sp.]|nr:transposase [Octadecabacter sp.]
MRKTTKSPGEKIVKDIKRATRKHYSSEEKIRIVLDGLRGEDSIAELCRREGISQGIYYKWSKDFMEAGKRRLAIPHVRQTQMRSKNSAAKQRILRKSSRNRRLNSAFSKKA